MEASTKAVVIAAGLGVTAYVLYRSVPQLGKTAASVGSAVNPLNPDNVFAGATNKVGAVLTGDKSFSLGSWVYDFLHPGSSSAGTDSTSTDAGSLLGTRPIDWGTGTGWDVVQAPTVPIGPINVDGGGYW